MDYSESKFNECARTYLKKKKKKFFCVLFIHITTPD